MTQFIRSWIGRRNFLKTAAVGAAVLASGQEIAKAAQSGAPTAGPASSSEIAAKKEKVALATRMLAAGGIVGSSGHVSMRIPGTDHALIGPRDVPRNVLTAADVVMVDMNSRRVEGNRRQPDETEIHTGVYRARPEVMAVVHTHPAYSVTFSIINRPILPVHMHGAIFGDGVPVFDYVGHVDTRELGDSLAHTLGNSRAVLIKMHGAAIVGSTIEEAFVAAFQLEENAQQQLMAEATGKVLPMTPEDVARCVRESWRPASIQKRWQYYLDKLKASSEA